MLKKLFTIFTITLLVSSLSFAGNGDKPHQSGGTARLFAIGNSPFVMDPTNMTVNPAWGSVYSHLVWGDLGSQQAAFGAGGVGQYAGANFRLNKRLTLGAIFTRNDFNGLSIASPDPLSKLGAGVAATLNGIVPNAVVALNNNLEVMGTFSSGSHTFGVGFSYTGTTNDTPQGTTGTNEGSVSQLGINVGVLSKLTRSFMLDAGVSFLLPSATFTPANGNESKVSQTIIAINARAFWKASKKVTIVPSVAFTTVSGTIDNGTGTDVVSGDVPGVTVLTLAFGANYTVGDFLLTGGPAFLTSSVKTPEVSGTSPELKTSNTIFPAWILGLEWNMNSWFVARVGYNSSQGKTTTESAADATTIVETVRTAFIGPNGATLGVGFRLDSFSLDATVNEDVLRQGFNNIGGGGATFAYLSMSYSLP